MYVLTLFIVFATTMASSTSEYNSKAACEYAALQNKTIAAKSTHSIQIVLASCMPKNERDIPAAGQ